MRQEQTVESGFVVRRAGQTSPSTGRKSAVRDAVPASLSTPQSVAAIAKSTEARAEDNAHLPLIVDAQSREAVSQALDAARRLVRQSPEEAKSEEAKQRLRAYVRRTPPRGRSKNALDLEV